MKTRKKKERKKEYEQHRKLALHQNTTYMGWIKSTGNTSVT